MSTQALSAVSAALPEQGRGAWFVGGCVRDRLLGRATLDVDIVVAGDAKSAARAVHQALGGDIFSLSDKFGTWRVLLPGGKQVDITELRGDSIEADLALRDFTVNAIAQDCVGEAISDPHGGRDDLASKTLRMVSREAFTDDPLRLVRLARFAVTLDFGIELATLAAAQELSGLAQAPAAERSFAELRALVAADDPVRGIRLLDELGLLSELLPEVARLKGLEQTIYHHKDVYEHTLEVLENVVAFERDDYAVFGPWAEKIAEVLAEGLGDQLTRGGGLRWGALLHDIGKPDTLTRYDDNRIGFPGHDIAGAKLVRAACKRLQTSERFAAYVAALTRHHMRLGFQIPKRPLGQREIYDYLVKSEPVEIEVGVLSVADRMATRGRKHEEAIPRHTEFALEMTELAFDWRENPREPLIRGDQLAAELGIEPGPKLGELLAEIARAQYAGEVDSAEGAVAFARTAL